MQKKRFIEKIVKKDYNDELETVLEHKKIGESEKNILLNILYKLENAYKDYKSVKVDVETKEEIVKKIINIIKNDCNNITLVKPSSKEAEILKNKDFLIDKKHKKIITYPIERKLLYCIYKISKKEKIIKDKYFLIDETLSNLINIGSAINDVEPIRDFNGFSWTTIKSEIENIEANIVYQNLRILLGHKFLNKWGENKEYIIDYFELFEMELIQKYGKKKSEELIELLKKISILLEVKNNKQYKRKMKKTKEEIFEKAKDVEDMDTFIKKVTEQKKEIMTQIEKIDNALNDNEKLKIEYKERNDKLPLEEQIFNIKLLKNILEKEREENLKKLEELNQLMNPKKFIEQKNELEEKKKYLELLNCENIDEELTTLIFKLQKIFLDCYEIKINNAGTKEEIIDLIYEFRYYTKIPFDSEININRVEKLKNKIEKIQGTLIKKAETLKIFNIYSNSEKLNYEIIKNIFITRVINLTDLVIKITKENEKIVVQLFDEDMLDNKIDIDIKKIKNIENIDIKLNKKIKVFI